jgi:hypothetical protein
MRRCQRERGGWAARAVAILAAVAFCGRAEIVINEVHYEPTDVATLTEFVELHNSGTNAVDLGGWSFSDGISFLFPSNTLLASGGYVVVDENPGALNARFGVAALGPFAGNLSNQGETITLRNAAGRNVDEVDYGVGSPWPTAAAGGGGSMELVNPRLDNNLG